MIDWVPITKVDNTYTFDFRCTKDISLSALAAAHLTIFDIVKKYPQPYTLYLSGGVDSQAMLYAWHTSGVKYSTFSAVYNHDLNRHDLLALEAFSQIHKIDIDYKKFDLFNFLETEHDYYANTYFCGSPQITTFMKLASLTKKGTVIMSGNFIKRGSGVPDSNNAGLFHYHKLANNNFIPWFFLESMDLAHAFTLNDYASEMTDDYHHKVALYQSHNFPVLAQPKKQNGFEKVKEWYDENIEINPSVQDRLSRKNGQISTRNFDMLYRNKYEAKFSYIKYNMICLQN